MLTRRLDARSPGRSATDSAMWLPTEREFVARMSAGFGSLIRMCFPRAGRAAECPAAIRTEIKPCPPDTGRPGPFRGSRSRLQPPSSRSRLLLPEGFCRSGVAAPQVVATSRVGSAGDGGSTWRSPTAGCPATLLRPAASCPSELPFSDLADVPRSGAGARSSPRPGGGSRFCPPTRRSTTTAAAESRSQDHRARVRGRAEPRRAGYRGGVTGSSHAVQLQRRQ